MTNWPSTTQIEALVEFLEENIGVARGYMKTALGKQEVKRKWAQLAVQLNSWGGVNKDGPGWAKYWTERKCSLKKLCAQQAALVRQTGGGSGTSISLSELDQRLVAVMGGTSFAAGDRGLAVNPFPQVHSIETPSTSQNMEIPMESEVVLEIQQSLPPSPTAGTSQEEGIQIAEEGIQITLPALHSSTTAPAGSTANPRRRTHRLARTADAEMDRMAALEERRVEAERISAEALADISRSLESLADARREIAQQSLGLPMLYSRLQKV